MAADIDVTDKVQIGWIDDEVISLDRCACGLELDAELLSLGRDEPWQCAKCGRELYITQRTIVWEKRV